MNRLSSYFDNAKLAKQYFSSASDFAKRKELEKAVNAMNTGVIYLMTAMNNVASIAFNKKPRARR